MQAPHDLTDLMLAPVALAVDARLSELGELSAGELRDRIALEANDDGRSEQRRQQALLHVATYLVEMHGWKASVDARGVRLTHGHHTFVLGIPPVVASYLTGSDVAEAAS